MGGVELDLFGIKFGGNSSGGREGKVIEEHVIDREEVLEALEIEGKCTFMSYDYKTKKLTVKVQKE